MVSKSIDTKTSFTIFFCIFVALLDSKVSTLQLKGLKEERKGGENPIQMSGSH